MLACLLCETPPDLDIQYLIGWSATEEGLSKRAPNLDHGWIFDFQLAVVV